jgi:hypothetical protein
VAERVLPLTPADAGRIHLMAAGIAQRLLNHRLRGRLHTIERKLRKQGVEVTYRRYSLTGEKPGVGKFVIYFDVSRASNGELFTSPIVVWQTTSGDYLETRYYGDRFKEGLELLVQKFHISPEQAKPSKDWADQHLICGIVRND